MSTSETDVSSFDVLPHGYAPDPIALPHFPDVLHAVVWRNWDFVDASHLAEVLGGTREEIIALGRSMGLPLPRAISAEEQKQHYMSIIRRNWHLLPYEQLCALLKFTPDELRYYLDYDDSIWCKVGGYKPKTPAVYYASPSDTARAHAKRIAEILDADLNGQMNLPAEPPFGFVKKLREFPKTRAAATGDNQFDLRMCYPYFLRYGDPLAGDGIDDVPEGYLAQLAAAGVNAIWMQGVLNKLAPWAHAPGLSTGWEERLENLRTLVDRCAKHGIDVLLYLNEPRALSREFFEKHPELRGVDETRSRVAVLPDLIALCTSTQEGKDFIVDSVRHIFQKVPGLGGVFTITYSENLTNCYSRDQYEKNLDGVIGREKNDNRACPRCQARGPIEIHAEINRLVDQGMRQAGSKGRLLWYVWSTPAEWIPGIIEKLPDTCRVLCISEWGKEFTRGDYTGKANEYSISVVGPSEQSLRQWDIARKRGLKTVAKIQAGTSFEMFLIPFLPATQQVAKHVHNLVDAGVDSLMMGWTVGGWPSANVEVAVEMAKLPRVSVREGMLNVARRRFGAESADAVVDAWQVLGDAFLEFPMDIKTVYFAPQCIGPANLLLARPSGLASTMIMYPFDDLDGWRGPYSRTTFQRQFAILANRWAIGVAMLDDIRKEHPSVEEEWRLAAACGICFRSTANQVQFIQVRESDREQAVKLAADELRLARELFSLVRVDSRIGFEATTQYAFTRFDLAESILNCRYILEEWSV